MQESATIQEIIELLKTLSLEEQRQVLDFTRGVLGKSPKQYPGKNLLQFVGTISKEDLKVMQQAIEEGCEQVDESEW